VNSERYNGWVSNELSACGDCGAAIHDDAEHRQKHDDFHDTLDLLLTNVYLRRPEVTPRIKQRAEELARERVLDRLRLLVEELTEDCDSCEDAEAALQRAATDIAGAEV
jgi:hypothetical protein